MRRQAFRPQVYLSVVPREDQLHLVEHLASRLHNHHKAHRVCLRCHPQSVKCSRWLLHLPTRTPRSLRRRSCLRSKELAQSCLPAA